MAQRPPSPREPIEIGTGQFEQLLDERAPALKQWPAWFRRNFTPAALYTIGGVVIGAVIVVTTYIATASADRRSNAALAVKLEALDQKMTAGFNDQANKLALVKCTTDRLAYEHKDEMWIVQADWNRRHHKPDPDRPKQPSTEGCPE